MSTGRHDREILVEKRHIEKRLQTKEDRQKRQNETAKRYRERHYALIQRNNKVRQEKQKTRMLAAKVGLGGRCVMWCGTTDLQVLCFDHIDPKTKMETVSNLTWARNAVFWNEVAKCQLVCHNCHFKITCEQRKNKEI
jgi:hypothetical protein